MTSRRRRAPLEGEGRAEGQARGRPQQQQQQQQQQAQQQQAQQQQQQQQQQRAGACDPRPPDRAWSGEGAGPSCGGHHHGGAEGAEEEGQQAEPGGLPGAGGAGGGRAADAPREQRWPDPEWEYHGPGTEAVPYRHTRYEGLVYLPYVRAWMLDDLRANNVLLERDVVIASFPKTGTTWLQTLLLSLHFGGPQRLRDPMRQSVWIEAAVCRRKCTAGEFQEGWGELRGVEPPTRVLKTHAQARVAPWVGGGDAGALTRCRAKLVLTWRDPRDVAVSCFHHITASNAYRYRGSWDDFLKMFLDGGTEGGDFWEWQLGWRRATADAVKAGVALWVHYEDLKSDLPGQVRRLQAFCDMPQDEALAAATAAAGEFTAMRALFERRNTRKLAHGKKFNAEHIRKGEVGGFGELMSEEQSREFERRTAQLEATLRAEGLLN